MGVPARSVSAASCPLIRGSLTGILPSATLGLLSSAATASCLRFGDPHVCRPSPRITFASRVDKRVPQKARKLVTPQTCETCPATSSRTFRHGQIQIDCPAQTVRRPSCVRAFSGASKTWTFSMSLHGWIHGVPGKRPHVRRPIATNDPGTEKNAADEPRRLGRRKTANVRRSNARSTGRPDRPTRFRARIRRSRGRSGRPRCRTCRRTRPSRRRAGSNRSDAPTGCRRNASR